MSKCIECHDEMDIEILGDGCIPAFCTPCENKRKDSGLK